MSLFRRASWTAYIYFVLLTRGPLSRGDLVVHVQRISRTFGTGHRISKAIDVGALAQWWMLVPGIGYVLFTATGRDRLFKDSAPALVRRPR